MRVASWTARAILQGLAMASEIPTKELYAHVIIQTQWAQNLIVASTASEDFTLQIHELTKVQLATVTYDLLPYLKSIPGKIRGVVYVIEAETSEREAMELVSAKGHNIMHARILGKSNSALLTFQRPHVPFYVKVGSAYTRCRPHRRSEQYCRACGEVGHRQDVFPHPDTNQCSRCGEKVITELHECKPRCNICDQPHDMASKECKRRLKPGPPSLHVRDKNASGKQQVTWNADTRQKVQHTQQEASTLESGRRSRPRWVDHTAGRKDDFPQLEEGRGNKCDKNCEKVIEELKI
ncbi:hypothetical protein HPB47_007940 [Ixodes persulcatus]|uniref:Uncharacterized protein n=1 Tax=Ixodes persulcatus TaxID=34615 RepID=A0AC60P661_IXOPE|nr:hypothetical protein HPB47_007940 [Ixodes persulcatus]